MPKRKIKVKFLDFYPGIDSEDSKFFIIKMLRKHYDVELCDDADYVIFSCYGEEHWYVPLNTIKIFYTGENLVPDFNACDYAVGFEYMDYEDCYFRLPHCYYIDERIIDRMLHKHEIPAGFDLKSDKPGFCSFMVTNPRGELRNKVFLALNEYKKVDSGGRFLNNVGGRIEDKLQFDLSHKFSLCFENSGHSGYTTEKLPEALAARTVPIYWGDPNVGRLFNKKAFIDARDFATVEELVEYVKKVDQDDDLYMSYLRQPAIHEGAPIPAEEMAKFEDWLLHIFEQPLDKAQRSNREMYGLWHRLLRRRLHPKLWRTYKIKNIKGIIVSTILRMCPQKLSNALRRRFF